MKNTDLKPGQKVTYTDINLRDNRGVIVAVQKGPRGGDCIIHWTRPLDCKSEECSFNLTEVTA